MVKKARAVSGQGRLPMAVHLPLENLQFDPENPRIAESLGRNRSQKHILTVLLGSDIDARELVPSFMENGYLPYEPLIVRPETKGKFTVLEGNRRLAALTSMRDSDDPLEVAAFRQHRLNFAPCMVFEGTRDQELAYLGLRHLSKTKDWSAAAKAAFVERVLHEGHALRAAARITNTSIGSLRVLLLTRRLFERAESLGIELPNARQEGEVLFWHLGDAVRRSNTKKYLEIMESDDPLKQPALNETRFERLVGWVYGNPKTRERALITSIRDIPDLDSVLANDRATNALEEGATLDEALEELQSAGASVSGHLERAKKSVQRATAGLSDVDHDGRKQVKAARAELGRALITFDGALS